MVIQLASLPSRWPTSQVSIWTPGVFRWMSLWPPRVSISTPPYRLTGPILPVNAENTKSEDPDRITGSDVPMDVHMDIPLVAGQRASPESAWPSEGTSNPAGAWRAVLGRLQLEMPRGPL